jgi:PQQ-like domain
MAMLGACSSVSSGSTVANKTTLSSVASVSGSSVGPTLSSASARDSKESVWMVSGWAAGPLVQIDPVTNRVVRSIDVPGFVQTSLVVDDQVWVVNTSTVSRYSAVDGASIGSVPLDGASGLLRAADKVVVSTESSLVVFDTTLKQLSRIDFGSSTGGYTFDGTFLWVSFSGTNEVAKIDPATGRELLRLTVGGHPGTIIFDQHFLWVSSEAENGLTKIDPATDKVVDQVVFGPSLDPAADFIGTMRWSAMVAGQLWLLSLDTHMTWSVKHISPTGQILERFEMPCCSANFATTGNLLWIAHNGGITRLDTVTGKTDLVRAIEPDSTPFPCGPELPVTVTVPDATSGPTDGAAAGTPETAPGQIVKYWTRPVGIVEVRWPPDPRQLSGAPDSADWPKPWGFDSSSLAPEGPTVRLYSGGQSATSTEEPGAALELSAPRWPQEDPPECRKIQVRFVAPDGATRTFGFSLADLSGPFDLGPLIGLESDLANHLDPSDSIECPGTVETATQVPDFRGGWTTPARALRAFLTSPAASPLDVPMPPRLFHQYHLTTNDSYRFEHFTNWNEHVTITVTRSDAGWHVSSWTRAKC